MGGFADLMVRESYFKSIKSMLQPIIKQSIAEELEEQVLHSPCMIEDLMMKKACTECILHCTIYTKVQSMQNNTTCYLGI